MNEDKVLEEKDRRGIVFSCSAAQWNEHIIRGHSVMSKNLAAVAATVRDPDYIYESHDSNRPLDYREVLYKKVPDATYYSDRVPYTVVVASVLADNGEIVTAYPSRKIGGGTIGKAIYGADDEG